MIRPLRGWALLGLVTWSNHAVGSVAAIEVVQTPPPGFETLSAAQTTQADVYFGGEYLTSAFVEFDLTQVELLDPLEVIQLIPNVRDPVRIAGLLGGARPTNAARLCTSRQRQDCGRLAPPVVDVLFDDSRFRLDIFLHPDELLVHRLVRERYLPRATADRSVLHNLRLNMAGTGSDRRFNVGSETFLAWDQSRLRSRYAVSDEGAAIYELAWQQDAEDAEFEIGSFRSLGRNLAFTQDVDVLGVRVATSTKTRTDLDGALGTPIYVFLAERSRVDVFRGGELLDSHYYDAGNQQVDTADFPDGAYELTLRVLGQSGASLTQTQFFARSGLMPPLGEPQYFWESGAIVDTLDHAVPELHGGAWMRAGASFRLRDNLSVDNEVIYADGTSLLQAGGMLLKPRWQLYAGAMVGSDGDVGYALRGHWRQDEISASFDLRRVEADAGVRDPDAYQLIPGGYTQASATIGFPLGEGRLFLRGRLNERDGQRDTGVGFSYWGALLQKQRWGGVQVDFTLDGHYSDAGTWLRAGIQVRWRGSDSSATLRPGVQVSREPGTPAQLDELLDGRWRNNSRLPGFGLVDRALYLSHDADRSVLGARFEAREFQRADFELGYQQHHQDGDFFYTMNNRFSVVTTGGRTTVGDGGSSAGAVLVDIDGPVGSRFQVIVDDRVVGTAWGQRPNVISLRPYATYRIRIRPLGDAIVGYDEGADTVTLYPGNVHTLEFRARPLTVLVGQALYADGTPVSRGRFENVEGYGTTDDQGWYQVEVDHTQPLLLRGADGAICELALPEFEAEQGLAVLEPLVCAVTRAPQ